MKKKVVKIGLVVAIISAIILTTILIWFTSSNSEKQQYAKLDSPELKASTDLTTYAVDSTLKYPFNLKVKQVSVSMNHSLAIDENGKLWSWGRGGTYAGYIGDGTTTGSEIPVNIMPQKTFIKISAGTFHCLAIDSSGQLWAWGRNSDGEVGDGTTQDRTTPVAIKSGTKFIDISAGCHSGAIDENYNLYLWGENSSGECADGTTTNVLSPKQVSGKYKKVVCNFGNTAVIDTSNKLWVAGKAEVCNVSSEYVAEKGDRWDTYGTKLYAVNSTKTYKDIALGGTHIMVIDTNNKLWTGGCQHDGELGNGTGNQNSYDLINIKPTSNFSSIAAVDYGSLAIDSNGKLWVWGRNTWNELGVENNYNDITTPMMVNPTKTYKAVSAHDFQAPSMVIDENDILWGAGDNSSLGIASGETYSKVYTQITAKYSTVTLNPNGGTIAEGENITEYPEGFETILPTRYDMTKTGYTFEGWYTNSSLSGTAVTKISTTETGNKTYWAKWTPNTYRVSLRTNGGTINSGDITEYTYGKTTNLPTNVTKTGYTFGGWYDNSSFTGNRVTSIGSTETESKTYYAKWDANTYTVTLNPNGGTINRGNVTSYTYGNTTTLPTSVTREGYTFGGWYNNSSLSGTAVTSISSTESGNKTYWAKWNAVKHIVTFKDGETVAKTEEVNHGAGATAPTLTKEGYVLRWDKTFNNVTSDLTVNAVWLKDTDKDGIPDIEDPETLVNYVVEHYKQNVAQNGYEAPEREIKQGNLGTVVNAIPKTYAGFSENETLTDRIPSGTVVDDGSLTLKLYYDRNTYTVALNPNGGTINSGNVTSYTYGTTTTLPTNVTKEGYTFGGWYDNAELTGNAVAQITASDLNNKTYYAKWNINVHTVTFKDGETVAKTEQVSHGAGATAPTLTKEGYVLRWDKTFNNVTSDLTVNAVWLKDTDKDGIPDIEDPETLVNYVIEHYKQNVAQNGYEEPERETKQGNLGTVVNAIPKTYAGFSENETSTDRIPSGTVVDDGSLTLKLYYDRNTYTVALNPNGGTINSGNVTSYTYGTTTTLPTNVTKEGYTFGGWYDNAELTGNAVAQITASDLNNKTYYAKWNANGNTAYKVLHYKQTENGYTLAETQNLTGQTGANVTALPKAYEGYAENVVHEERIPSGIVLADGSLELKLYYDMLTYEVTFKDGETVAKTETVNYGRGATAPALTKEGYVLRWDKEFNNVTSNLTVNAVWLRDTDGDGIPDIEDPDTLVEYIVKHYKQQGNTNTYELAEEEKLQGQLGSVVNAIPKAYVGYAENTEAAERRPSGTITSDEKLELILLYYRLKYTVTFKDGDEIVSVVEVLHGEEATPPNLTKPGYILSWDKALDNITGEQTINAVWTKIPEEQREYKVEHYVETKEGGYSLKETDKLVGDIGDVILAVPKTYNEYELNEEHEGTIREGEIKEDSEVVLKLYYKYKRFTVIFKDGNDIVKEEEVIYGGTATPPNLTKPGYILSWNKVLDDITKEQTITAVWTRDPNYKDPNDGKDEKPSILPKTGEETVTLGAIMGLLGIAVVYFVKYKF